MITLFLWCSFAYERAPQSVVLSWQVSRHIAVRSEISDLELCMQSGTTISLIEVPTVMMMMICYTPMLA